MMKLSAKLTFFREVMMVVEEAPHAIIQTILRKFVVTVFEDVGLYQTSDDLGEQSEVAGVDQFRTYRNHVNAGAH